MGRPAHRLGSTVCEVSAVAPIAAKFGQHGEMTRCAKSGLTHRSKTVLVDHLVGVGDQVSRRRKLSGCTAVASSVQQTSRRFSALTKPTTKSECALRDACELPDVSPRKDD